VLHSAFIGGENVMKKRATIYFDPLIHRILKLKAAETDESISAVVNKALKVELLEDAEDLQACHDRMSEPSVSYESFLKKLKEGGKI